MPAPAPVTGPGVTGTVVRFAAMPSTHVAPRNVDVWLPPSYGKDPAQRYPVLYMHDGQNLFDPATSYGNVDWAVDEAMTRLIGKGTVREAIVVGIWNTNKRREEYMPQRAVRGNVRLNVPGADDLKPADIISDRYLRFLVQELKPRVDVTLPHPAGPRRHRGDGLEHGRPDLAVRAGPNTPTCSARPAAYPPTGPRATAPPWWSGWPSTCRRLRARTGPVLRLRHCRRSTRTYEPYQRRADEILRKAGYVEGQNWITRKFEGAEHSEKAWRLRVDQPLVFLLGH